MSALAKTLARAVGLAVLLYSGIVLLGNVVGAMAGAEYESGEILLVVIGVGAIGVAGSIVFLLSLDGPDRWRTTTRRGVGWMGMMIAALLPTSWLYLIAPIAAVGGLSLLLAPDKRASGAGDRRPVKRTFARLTGLVLLLYGGWMFTVNLIEDGFGSNTYEPTWVLYVVLGLGLAGGIGGALYLLSIDGPERFRTRKYRVFGWAGMLICAALPSSLLYVLLILVAVSSYSLFDLALDGSDRNEAALRSG